jgi:hypothetical protein
MLREPGDWLQHVPHSGSMSPEDRQAWNNRLAHFAMTSLAEMQASPNSSEQFSMSQAIDRLCLADDIANTAAG